MTTTIHALLGTCPDCDQPTYWNSARGRMVHTATDGVYCPPDSGDSR